MKIELIKEVDTMGNTWFIVKYADQSIYFLTQERAMAHIEKVKELKGKLPEPETLLTIEI